MGQAFVLDAPARWVTRSGWALDYPELVDDVEPGTCCFWTTAASCSTCERIDGREIHTRVRVGGELSNNKGINARRRPVGAGAHALRTSRTQDCAALSEVETSCGELSQVGRRT